jgi:prophage regulatory protein
MTDTTYMLRLPAVLERRGTTRTRLYSAIQQGLMTPGIHRANSTLALWPAHEIETINRAEIAGATADELKALVRQLVKQRQADKPAVAAA